MIGIILILLILLYLRYNIGYIEDFGNWNPKKAVKKGKDTGKKAYKKGKEAVKKGLSEKDKKKWEELAKLRSGNPRAAFGTGITAVAESGKKWGGQLGEFADDVGGELVDNVGSSKKCKAVEKGDLTKIIPCIKDTVKEIVGKEINKVMEPIIKEIDKVIKPILNEIDGKVIKEINKVMNPIIKGIDGLVMEQINKVMEGIPFKTIKNLLDKLVKYTGIAACKNVLNDIGTIDDCINDIVESKISKILGKGLTTITEEIETKVNKITEEIETKVNKITEEIETKFNNIKGIVKDVVEDILGVIPLKEIEKFFKDPPGWLKKYILLPITELLCNMTGFCYHDKKVVNNLKSY